MDPRITGRLKRPQSGSDLSLHAQLHEMLHPLSQGLIQLSFTKPQVWDIHSFHHHLFLG